MWSVLNAVFLVSTASCSHAPAPITTSRSPEHTMREAIPLTAVRLVARPSYGAFTLNWNPGGWTDIAGHRVYREDIEHYIRQRSQVGAVTFDIYTSDEDSIGKVADEVIKLREFVEPEVPSPPQINIDIVVSAFRGVPK